MACDTPLFAYKTTAGKMRFIPKEIYLANLKAKFHVLVRDPAPPPPSPPKGLYAFHEIGHAPLFPSSASPPKPHRRARQVVIYHNGLRDSDGSLPVEIPCGHCVSCRAARAREWSIRLNHCYQYYKFAYTFVLTYSSENLPTTEFAAGYLPRYVTAIGEYKRYVRSGESSRHFRETKKWLPSLYPPHITQFTKSLKQKLKKECITDYVYFIAGEYGKERSRPHYHVLLLTNKPLFHDSYVLMRKSFKNGFPANPSPKDFVYSDRFLTKIWKYGHVRLECPWLNLTAAELGYVAGYATKKITDVEKLHGRIPEFARMSRHIGLEYLARHCTQILKTRTVYTVVLRSGTAPVPRYYVRVLHSSDDYFGVPREFRPPKALRNFAAVARSLDNRSAHAPPPRD